MANFGNLFCTLPWLGNIQLGFLSASTDFPGYGSVVRSPPLTPDPPELSSIESLTCICDHSFHLLLNLAMYTRFERIPLNAISA